MRLPSLPTLSGCSGGMNEKCGVGLMLVLLAQGVSAQGSLPFGSVLPPLMPPQQHCWSGLGPPVLSCGLPLLADSSRRGAVMLAKPVTTTPQGTGACPGPSLPWHELYRQPAGIQAVKARAGFRLPSKTPLLTAASRWH